jgi:hypothetical protein
MQGQQAPAAALTLSAALILASISSSVMLCDADFLQGVSVDG